MLSVLYFNRIYALNGRNLKSVSFTESQLVQFRQNYCVDYEIAGQEGIEKTLKIPFVGTQG